MQDDEVDIPSPSAAPADDQFDDDLMRDLERRAHSGGDRSGQQ